MDPFQGITFAIVCLLAVEKIIQSVRSFVRDSASDKKKAATVDELEKVEAKFLGELKEVKSSVSGIELSLERRCTKLETQMELRAALELHRPHPEFARRDELVEKYAAFLLDPTNNKFTLNEMKEFIRLLEGILRDDESSMKDRINAEYMLERIKQRFNLATNSTH